MDWVMCPVSSLSAFIYEYGVCVISFYATIVRCSSSALSRA